MKPLSVLRVHETQNQGSLHQVIRHLFPHEKTSLKNPATNKFLELDVWLPNLKLAFEFQDSYHYTSTWYSHSVLDDVRRQDNLKLNLVEDRGETLIAVPYWWDGKKESLVATIRNRRPELLPHIPVSCPPISQILLVDPRTPTIPEIGELMLASFPPASFFKTDIDIDNPWWLGEKYDGVRCCWHSGLAKLYTRSGLEIVLPDRVTHFLGMGIHIDAEIWFGKKCFYEAQDFIQSSSYPHNLEYLRLVAFDNPTRHSNVEYEKRYETALQTIQLDHPFIVLVGRMKVTSRAQVTRMIRTVLGDAGEGVILRQPNSPYISGRSGSLLKLKAARSDLEALVAQVNDSSCILRFPSGKVIQARTPVKSECNKEDVDVKTGDVVTVAIEGGKGSLEIIRVRRDVTWRAVVQNSLRPSSSSFLKSHSKRVVDYSPRTYGYWVHMRKNQMKALLVKIMHILKLDPSLPACWYSVSPDEFKLFKGVKPLLNKFDGSFAKAVMYLFPDIGLKMNKFTPTAREDVTNLPRGYWRETKNRKLFFDSFAVVHKFDPLQPSNWYKTSYHSIFSTKNASSVLRYHEGSYVQALLDLYPAIGLDASGFSKV